METKLTLSMDESVIKRAKEFAKRNHTSLSKLIEDYFSMLTSKVEDENSEITPLVKSLSGVLDLPDNFNYKQSRSEHLQKKYR